MRQTTQGRAEPGHRRSGGDVPAPPGAAVRRGPCGRAITAKPLKPTVDGISDTSPGSGSPTTRLGAGSGAPTGAEGGFGADRGVGGVAAPASVLGGDVARARGPGPSDARPGCMPKPAMSSAASRSCSPKRSSMGPSTIADRTTSPVAASTRRAVIRNWSPSRWYPPVTSHRTPRRRPTSRTTVLPTGAAAMTSTAAPAGRTAIGVSAIPAPIQSSPGAPLMLPNGRMARRSGAGSRGARSTSRCAVAGIAATTHATNTGRASRTRSAWDMSRLWLLAKLRVKPASGTERSIAGRSSSDSPAPRGLAIFPKR